MALHTKNFLGSELVVDDPKPSDECAYSELDDASAIIEKMMTRLIAIANSDPVFSEKYFGPLLDDLIDDARNRWKETGGGQWLLNHGRSLITVWEQEGLLPSE